MVIPPVGYQANSAGAIRVPFFIINRHMPIKPERGGAGLLPNWRRFVFFPKRLEFKSRFPLSCKNKDKPHKNAVAKRYANHRTVHPGKNGG
jgi:hypothetical protein